MNPYQILNVSENCSDEELTKAYKSLAKKYHPDLNPSPEAAKKMVEINCAYDEIKKMREQGLSYSQYQQSQANPYSNYQGNARNYSTEDEAYYHYVDQALRSGNFFMAFQYLNAIRNRDDRFYYYASTLYEQFGNIPEALNFIEQALKMKNDPVYQNSKTRLEGKMNTYQAQQAIYRDRAKTTQRIITFINAFWIIMILISIVSCIVR